MNTRFIYLCIQARMHAATLPVTRALLTCIASLFIFTVHAQVPQPLKGQLEKAMPKPMPASPTVASLERFGSYEVGHYTGLPQIEIPIFEVRSGKLTVPITLSYHASGVRMSDPGSWVGYGWSLMAGGQISRETRASPDERNYYSSPLYEFPQLCGEEDKGNFNYIDKIAKEIYDADPDIFSYFFNGRSGKFILGHHGEYPFLFPFEAIRIRHSGMGSTKWSVPLDQFELTDESGTLYRFGKSSDGKVFSEITGVDRGEFYPSSAQTSWPLMEILAANCDDKIVFDYQSAGDAIISEQRNSITVVDKCFSNGADACPQLGVQPIMNGTSNYSINQLGLKDIFFEGGKVSFILGDTRNDNFGANSSLRSLDRIEIYSFTAGVYSLVKVVKFVYDYFGYSDDTTAPVRLKLKELQFFGAVHSDEPVNRYQFIYHTDSFSWHDGTPYSKDYWGYFNGKANGDLIPRQVIQWTDNSVHYIRTEIGSADRSTNPDYMKEGVLKRIVFPTGGFTDFDYETHRYRENGKVNYAGGLRIASVKSYADENALPLTKTYRYGEGESGFGEKTFRNDLLYYYTEDAVHDICCITMPNSVTCPVAGKLSYTVRNYFSNSAIEIGSRDGSPVVYPVVTEYLGEPKNNIGKIVYEYDNKRYVGDSMNIILGPKSSKNYKNDLSWRRGKLTTKSIYDSAGHLLNTTTYTYAMAKGERRHIGTAVDQFISYPKFRICNSDCLDNEDAKIDQHEYYFTSYYQSSGAMKLMHTTDKSYFNDNLVDTLVSHTSNHYDPRYLLPVMEENANAAGEIVRTRTSYPFSFAYYGSDEPWAIALKHLDEMHVLNAIVEQYSALQKVKDIERIISGQVMLYTSNAANTGQILPHQLYILECDVPFPLGSFMSMRTTPSGVEIDAHYKPRLMFSAYDPHGNIATFHKSDDKSTSYLWGYDHTLPIAEVDNTDLINIAETFGERTYEYGSSFSDNFSTERQLTPSLTIDHTQMVAIDFRIIDAGGIRPKIPVTVDFILRDGSGAVIIDPATFGEGTYHTDVLLNPGTYTFWYTGLANSTSLMTSTVRFEVTAHYTVKHFPKVFHTSFEDTGEVSDEAKTGNRIHRGKFAITLPLIAGNYTITWWQRNDGEPWIFRKDTANVPAYSTYTVGSDAQFVDEVRMYPETATMVTRTYDPVLGTTSSTDANNVTTYYEYDTFNRLKLIRDGDKKIVKSFHYHYKH